MKTQTQRHPPTYRAFLENKIDIAPLSGIDVAESELNPALKHHQKVSVLWALRGGRRGIFARFGLGKSAMQLEWCRILQVHEGGQTLIVMPLNVLPEFRADAVNILGMDPPPYCRTMAEVKECSAPIVLTNYERVRDGDIDPRAFTAVSLDEAATLRSFYPFFPGISVPNYTVARLEELNARNVEYGGKQYTRYEIRQMRSALERKVRKYQRRYLAEQESEQDTTPTALQLRDARQTLNAFIEATGDKVDGARTQVAGFGYQEATHSTTQAKGPFDAFRRENLAKGEEELLPGHDRAVIPQKKLTSYALNLDHPKGGGKAVAFRDVLGYTKENASALADALRGGLGQWKARPRTATPYGQPYEVKMILTGANGRQATVKTGWLVEREGAAPRLISVYLYKQK